jgi:hypothetical protein
LHPGVIIMLLVIAGALGGFIFVILVVPFAAMARDMYQYAYLRLGDVPPDEALDRSLGEYGAKALRERLQLEQVVPAADLGNPGFGTEGPATPPPDPALDSAAGDESDPAPEPEGARPRRRLRFLPGRSAPTPEDPAT